MPQIDVFSQLNQTQLALAVQRYASGASFSGNFLAYVTNSGWLGPLAVTTTGNQTITGAKRFLDPVLVNYSGGSGAAPSALWVSDQISASASSSSAGLAATSGYALGISGALSAVRVTGSNTIPNVNLTGYGGTLVFSSGGFVFVSGGAGGGGGAGDSDVQVTGSSVLGTANFTGVGSVVLTYDGTYVLVSGAAGADATLSGYVEGNFVHRGAIDELVSGIKVFTGNPWVPPPTAPSGVVNAAYLSGVSGVLAAQSNSTTNIFNITGTGTINNYFSGSGSVTNNFNDYQTVTSTTVVTGNYNIASFFFDPVITGLNIAESFVGGLGYYFTGAAFSCRTSGSGPVNGGILSGKLYQVDSNNTEQTLYTFTYNSGIIYSGSPGFLVYVTGRNRIGVSITNSLSGIQKMCIGVFGGLYG